MSKLETLKCILWKRSGLHLRDALARFYLYLSSEETQLYDKEIDQLIEKYEVEVELPF